jgi:EAL domain-containing protein (putative c-di-GMP-specific phosphodiesterase class I)
VERLMELGCDAAQGYLFGRPMDAGRLPGFLARGGR